MHAPSLIRTPLSFTPLSFDTPLIHTSPSQVPLLKKDASSVGALSALEGGHAVRAQVIASDCFRLLLMIGRPRRARAGERDQLLPIASDGV